VAKEQYQVTVKHDRGITKYKVNADSPDDAERIAMRSLPRRVKSIYYANAVPISKLKGKSRRVYVLQVTYPSQRASKETDNAITRAVGKKPYSTEAGFVQRKFSYVFGKSTEAHEAKNRIDRKKFKEAETIVVPTKIVGKSANKGLFGGLRESVAKDRMKILIREIIAEYRSLR